MKLASFVLSGDPRDQVGLVLDEGVLDLRTAVSGVSGGDLAPVRRALDSPCGQPMLRLLESWGDSLPVLQALAEGSSAGSIRPHESVRLLAPVPRPTSMRDGYAFRQHVEAARRNRGVPMIEEFDDFPVFYFTNHQAVTGPGDVPVRDEHLDRLDFELECAIVIGRQGRDISATEADSIVAGYMVMNDWSARRLQMDEMKLNLGPAKGKDFATSIGPWLVTPDELQTQRVPGAAGDRYDLTMTTTVNGKEVSRGNLQDMSWTFAQIVERASYGVTLFPGDVIGSGTVGTGCLLELNGSKTTDNWWLADGDVVECSIDRLGTLRNRVRRYAPGGEGG